VQQQTKRNKQKIITGTDKETQNTPKQQTQKHQAQDAAASK
jgi:hypothetical protein